MTMTTPVPNKPNNGWYQKKNNNKIPNKAESKAYLDAAYANQGTIPSGPPVNVTTPAASGLPNVGQTLSCSNGVWDGQLPITYTYQWTRNGVNISGATTATYLLVTADLGTNTFCKVTATNAVNNAVAVSNTIGPIEPALEAPVNVTPPAVTGTTTVGSTLSANGGTWTGYPAVTPSYQWKRDGSLIVGANTSTYLLDAADETHMIKCTVTGTNSSGSSAADSNSVGPITAGGVNPLLTIGALTLPNAGARVVGSGLTNGTYQTYWTISGGTTLTRNATVGTPTPGTYNMGGVNITVEANVRDVGTGELAAVIALGSASLDGTTIKILPGADAGGSSIGSTVAFPVTLAVPAGLTITSRDPSNVGFVRRMTVKHSGLLTLNNITVRDFWKSGDYPWFPVIDIDNANYAASSTCKFVMTACEVYSDTITSANMNPSPTTSVTTGNYYIISTVTAADWSAIGGPVSAVIGDSFMCTSTNANITALGAAKPWPHTQRLIQGAAVFGTNQVGREITVTDSYLHNGEYGMTGWVTRLDVQRNRFDSFYGDMMQFQPIGTETLWRVKDNWMQGAIGDAASPFGVHLDYLQANLINMTQANTTPYEVIGNRFFGKDGSEAGQGIFFENPAAFKAYLVAEYNMIMNAQANGLTLEQPAAASSIRYNTLMYDMKYSPTGLVPKITADLEIGSGATVRENIHSGLAYTSGTAPLTWAKTVNNQQFATFDNTGMAAYLTGTDFNSTNIADLAAFTAAAQGKVGSAVDTAFPKIGASFYYSYGAIGATGPTTKSGLGTGTASPPTYVAPSAMVLADWDATPGNTKITFTVNSAPSDGGSIITDYEGSTDGGTNWFSLGLTGAGSYDKTGLTNGVSYNCAIRAKNAIGSASVSDVKTKTPVNTYSINAVRFATTGDYAQSNAITANGSKFALAVFGLYVPTAWPASTQDVLQFKNASGNGRFFVAMPSSGRLQIIATNAASTSIADFTMSSSELSANAWYTLAISLDTTSGVQRWQVYKRPDGGSWSAVTPSSSSITADGIIENCTRFWLKEGGPDMYFADVWATISETIDLSNATNRDKFLPSADKGAAGATPTGTSPAVFLSGSTGSWVTNKGTGGGLTLTGSITTAPSAPT